MHGLYGPGVDDARISMCEGGVLLLWMGIAYTLIDGLRSMALKVRAPIAQTVGFCWLYLRWIVLWADRLVWSTLPETGSSISWLQQLSMRLFCHPCMCIVL